CRGAPTRPISDCRTAGFGQNHGTTRRRSRGRAKSSPSSDRRRTPDTVPATRTRSSRSNSERAGRGPPSPCQTMPSQLAPVHRRRHEGAETLPAVADATAPPLAAPAGHFLGSRGPRASRAASWREDEDAFPASGVPGEDMHPAWWLAVARRDEIAPPRWRALPYRDALR